MGCNFGSPNKQNSGAIRKAVRIPVSSSQDIRKVYRFDPNVIGNGKFGNIRLATPIKFSHKIFAVKSVVKEKLKIDPIRLQQELILLRDLDHPNIVKFYQTFEDYTQIHFVMEYCSGGNLRDYAARKGLLSEEKAAKIMAKAFAAVKYVHSKGIVHRDIKEENFLLSDRTSEAEIKLIDFGLSEITTPQKRLRTRTGTPVYMAPEVFDSDYDYRCDYWSLGVMMYSILVGELPFQANSSEALKAQVRAQEIDFESKKWSKISPEAKDLCKALLTRDPAKRISAAEALRHPWIQAAKSKLHVSEPPDVQQVLLNLISFAKKKRFVKEVLKVLTAVVDDKYIKPLKDLFNFFDVFEEGEITVEALKKVLTAAELKSPEDTLQTLIQTISGYEDSHSIKYTDFVVANIDPKIYMTEDVLYGLFKNFDAEDAGAITIASFREQMTRSGKRVRSEEIDEILKQVSFADKVSINFEEFSAIITEKASPSPSPMSKKRTLF